MLLSGDVLDELERLSWCSDVLAQLRLEFKLAPPWNAPRALNEIHEGAQQLLVAFKGDITAARSITPAANS